MPLGSRVRALVGAVAPDLVVQSVRRELVRPALVAFGAVLLVAAPALLLGASAAGVALVLWVPLVASLVLLLSRVGRLERAVDELGEGIGVHLSLAGLVGSSPKVLPRLGDHAMAHGSMYALLDLVARRRPQTIVELGPGASTVFLHRLLDTAAQDTALYGVEHDPAYARRVVELAAYHGVDRLVVVEAPLEPLSLDGWQGRWYSRAALGQLPERIDVLVVDGPPGRLGPRSRYPAYPLLRDRLAVGAFVFVDDAERASEAEVIAAWLRSGELEIVDRGPTFAILRRST